MVKLQHQVKAIFRTPPAGSTVYSVRIFNFIPYHITAMFAGRHYLPTGRANLYSRRERSVFNVVIAATGLDALAAELDPAYNSKLAQCGTNCITCAIKLDIKQI
jgi:intracellular sulfur oxidation DsrE/DsrF family protein